MNMNPCVTEQNRTLRMISVGTSPNQTTKEIVGQSLRRIPQVVTSQPGMFMESHHDWGPTGPAKHLITVFEWPYTVPTKIRILDMDERRVRQIPHKELHPMPKPP
jgi:hypothetical protein